MIVDGPLRGGSQLPPSQSMGGGVGTKVKCTAQGNPLPTISSKKRSNPLLGYKGGGGFEPGSVGVPSTSRYHWAKMKKKKAGSTLKASQAAPPLVLTGPCAA